MKTKIFNTFTKRLILLAINLIESKFVSKIVGDEVQAGVRMLLDPIRNTVEVLADENPRNKEQVGEVWRSFAHNDVWNYGNANLPKLLAKIKNDEARTGLAHLSTPTLRMIQLLNDENTKDDEQIIELWSQFVKDPGTHDVVLSSLIIPTLLAKFPENETVLLLVALLGDLIESEKQGYSIIEEDVEGI